MGFLRSYSNSVREAKDRSILFSTYSGYFFKSETARPLGGKKKKKKRCILYLWPYRGFFRKRFTLCIGGMVKIFFEFICHSSTQ